MHFALAHIITSVNEANSYSMGAMFNSMLDLKMLKKLHIPKNLKKLLS